MSADAESGGDSRRDAAPGVWWRRLADRHDARLIPAALTVWLSTLLGIQLGWFWTVVSGGAVSLAGLIVLRRTGRSSDRARLAAWALVLCGLTTSVWTGYRLHQDATNPLRALAARGAVVDVRVRLTEPPKPINSAGFGGRPGGVRSVLVRAEVERLSEGGRTTPAAGAVIVLAPDRSWSGLLRGQAADAWGELTVPMSRESAVAVVRVRGAPEHVSPASWAERAAESLRRGLRQAAASLPGDSKALLPALVIGDTTGLRRAVVDDFRTAGMAYLMAVGGFHFMIVCGALLWLLRRCGVGPRVNATVTGLALAGFLEVAGPKPSVLRAALMVAVTLIALGTGRVRSASSALAACVIALVLWRPEFGGDVSFALSVFATGAMVSLAKPTADALSRRRIPAGLAELLAVAVVAHLATAPLIAGAFGQFGVVAIGANVMAEPAFVPAMVLGALALVCSSFSPWLAGWIARLAQPATEWLLSVAHHAARMPAASLPWPKGWLGGFALAALVVAIVLACRSARLRTLMVALLVGVFVVVVPIRVVAPGWPPRGWAMVDCDVGQGDGEVLATADPGRAVVVDTGPDETGIDGCLSGLGITRVPLLVLSHLHADHVGGLAAVLRGRAVGAIAVGPSRVPAWSWRQVRQEAAAVQIPLVELRTGQRLTWPGLALDVLGPLPTESRPAGDDPSGTAVNNSSLVLRAFTAAGRVLLTGDIELEAQSDLMEEHVDVAADILKVPHHGSRFSAPAFLDAVRARIAVTSVGAGNPYGHPSALTLTRLSADGALVLRTDRDGDIAIMPGRAGPTVVRHGDPRRPATKGSSRPPPSAGALGGRPAGSSLPDRTPLIERP